MKAQIYKYDFDTEKHILMVTFKLIKGKIDADWKEGSMAVKDYLENHGIVTANGHFTIGDGEDFLKNLPIAYSNSSKYSAVVL